jgi:glutaconate CoA-transferase subunit B
LLAVDPGISVEDIRANSGFEILIPEEVETTQPPTSEERALLHKIDPAGIVIGN